MDKHLVTTVVQLCKPRRRRRDCQRQGFADAAGQVFLAPKATKRADAWRLAMTDKGYTFA